MPRQRGVQKWRGLRLPADLATLLSDARNEPFVYTSLHKYLAQTIDWFAFVENVRLALSPATFDEAEDTAIALNAAARDAGLSGPWEGYIN